MIKALSQHAWLLLTFRHNGAGLPTGYPGMALLIVIASVLAAARWDSWTLLGGFANMATVFIVVVWLAGTPGARLAGGFMIISACIDTLAILAGNQQTGPMVHLSGWYELIAGVAFCWRAHKSRAGRIL